MSRRILITAVAILLLVAGGIIFWPAGGGRRSAPEKLPGGLAPFNAARMAASPATNSVTVAESTAPLAAAANASGTKTNALAYRLANTTKAPGKLLRDDHAILLENALIDSSRALDFQFPDSLKPADEPGAYLVQSRGAIGAAFRTAVAAAGVQYVSYIPNNAWLVQATAAQAEILRGQATVQAVLPWLPVYKLKSDLLVLAMQGRTLPPEATLNLLAYSGARNEVLAQLAQLNTAVLAEERSPFGSVFTVQPDANADWLALARLGGVQILERAHPRALLNDLTRVRVGVAENAITETNYFGLTGKNIIIGINDTGVDATHADLVGRIFASSLNYLVDSNGHGTHVAGTLAGSGAMSTNVIYARGSSSPGTNGQFRGMAPGAKLYVQRFASSGAGVVTDSILQENTARTNAFISNNSWGYSGDNSYDLAAASYDAAVRDSLPGVTGSQPVLYVFAAGNSGGGSDGGLSGTPGTVLSPATAKNVISVGAIELARDITNIVTKITGLGTTNQNTNATTPWKAMTSSGNQVAQFSSRGNVGIGVEGDFGRFKPDVVAPGTFVVSTRSAQWDEIAYYNPTNHHYTTLTDQVVGTNGLTQFAIFLPDNAVGFSITLVPNNFSPSPFPDLPIYLRASAAPTTTAFDARRTNSVAVPPDLAGVGTQVGKDWSYAIGNPTGSEISLDIFTDVITTNDLGDYFQVLSNLNNSICSTNGEKGVPPNYYRYESGTSMAAPAVSGTLALMEEYFLSRGITNSPALMKALLINGARSVGGLYDFQVQNSINYQGWGLPKLNNSLPPGITNAFNPANGSSGTMLVFDQSPTNALATAQSQTRFISVNPEAGNAPLRITLAWTDPAGNPAAGVKLVNDLDLIVTNLDDPTTPLIYYGNDIPGSSIYTQPWDTALAANFDSVNNVENVFISPVLGTNYSITVLARRVNVNAVTAHTNDVVQDYALVISSGSTDLTNALSFTNGPRFSVVTPDVTYVSNSITAVDFQAAFLENQRVGANTPLLGTTNGMTNQWKFYVVTNNTGFTNAAFLISLQTDLAVPRLGVFADYLGNATRTNADLDLYVSTDSNLTNLSPTAIDAAFKALTRNDISGDELIILSNAQPVYYVGVKSEDAQAGQFDFFAIFSLLPLGAEDGNGFVRAFPMTGYPIPDGSPTLPRGTRFVAFPLPSTSGRNETVRRVVVTNNVSHENYGDIISAMSHNSRTVVLDNHRSLTTPPYPVPPGPYAFLYDDSGQGDFPGAIPPDGPGTFQTYMGERPGGTWYFVFSDDAVSQSGIVNDLRLRLDRQCDDSCEMTNYICGGNWLYFTKDIVVEATNLEVCLNIITASSPQPLELYIRKGKRPTANAYDFKKTITPGGWNCLTVDKSQLPPLTPGRYFIGVHNPGTKCETFVYKATVLLGPPPTPNSFNGAGNQPILDDAATNYTIFVPDDKQIARVDVGLRIDHPRVSDLAVTLISPRGTRVLLVENRGGTTTSGFGSSLTVTNFTPVAANGGPAAQTNFIETGSTVGSVTIDYDFHEVPDQMRVYYEGILLADTGLISGAGRLRLNYGPGASTQIEIRMNEFGNTNASTLWDYSVSSYNTANSYLIFTENTNLTTTPIKFAAPPYVGAAATNYVLSDFESPVAAINYLAPTVGLPNGWNVLTNQVTVMADPANAQTGSNYLALANGQIQRALPTVPGRNYILRYWFRGPGAVAWWRGEGNGIDQINGNNGTVESGTTYSAGQVGQAFNFTADFDRKVSVPDQPVFQLTNSLAIEGWIRPMGPGSEILWRGDRRAGYDPYFLQMNGDSTLGFIIANDVGPGGTSATVNAPLAYNQWWHVVGMLDGNSGVMSIYTNGALAAQTTTSIRPFSLLDTNQEPVIGIGNVGTHEGFSIPFNGYIDEISLYSRALSASEIKAIYNAGAAGKFDSSAPAPQNLAKAKISVGAQTNIIFGNNTSWQSRGFTFTATSNQTLVDIVGLEPGMLLDTFTLSEGAAPRFVLPEESLNAFVGENTYGTWQLEILDTRTGATNNVNLIDWQLQFVYQTNTAAPRVLNPGTPVDVSLPPGQIIYFVVDVPAFAQFATNILFNSDQDLGFYFNQNVPPGFGHTNIGDVVFASPTRNWSETLSATNIVPPTSTKADLLPGQRYYLAVENLSAFNASFIVYVDFDLRALPPFVDLTNGVQYCTVNPFPFALDYYHFIVSSNAVRAQFEIDNPSGDMTLLLRRSLPPALGNFDYISANASTNDEFITVFDFSQPVKLTPGDWYFAAVNLSPGPVTYCAGAWEWLSYGTNIVITNVFMGTNSFCLTWTSLPGVRYYIEGLTNLTSTNWVTVSPTITGTGNATTYCVPLPSPIQFFRVREGQALSPYTPQPYITRILKRFNGVEITWSGPPGQQYKVEWSPTLVPTVWTQFTETITSTTGIYQYLDDGSQTGGFNGTRYYRLVLLP